MTSPKSRTVAAFFAFVSPVGLHRAYVQRPIEESLIMLALAVVGIGVLWSWIEGLQILAGTYVDGRGLPLKNW